MPLVPTQQAIRLLEKRYFRPGETRWSDVAFRVANHLATSEEELHSFKQIIEEGWFIPNTPCLINAGKEDGQLSACFVLPVEDDIEQIFDTVKHTALIHKSGGGSGFNFSHIRPAGFPVKSTNGVASGPVSFMKVFDAATAEMKQGGVRRGANMGILNIDHPDIVKFIHCKAEDKQISNFNISVAITNKFMSTLLEEDSKTPIQCVFGSQCFYLLKPDGRAVQIADDQIGLMQSQGELFTHQDIWYLLTSHAWKNGEPGVIFIDTINAGRDPKSLQLESTNPCGEQPLLPYESCVLGSINLSSLVRDGAVDYGRLAQIARIGTIFLNRVIDKSCFPLPQISEATLASRKIGLGVMGFADMLLKLKIRYGSETSLDLADRVMECIHQAARETSIAGNFRNEVLTTIAPTGSISIIAGCSSGIEPIPYWETHHKREDLPDEVIVHTLAKPYVERGEKLPDCFVTAKELTPEEHITMQSVFQRHTDNAVSKTILFGEKATQEEVSKAMASAWEMGCKGITVYRDGSRADQVLSDARSVPRASNQATGASVERPYRLPGFTYKVKLDLGNDRFENLYVVVNDFPSSEPFEVFINGNIRDLQPNMAQFIDSLTRFISLCFRNRVAIGDIVEQLEKIPHAHLFSIPHKLAHILREHSSTGAKCPECGGQIAYSEGCMKCACGWSKCG